MNKPLFLIAAVDKKFGIGKKGSMPWHLKKELRHFHVLTSKTENPDKKNMVIMGRRTWDSLPVASRPLRGRKNVVISQDHDFSTTGAVVANSLAEALHLADDGVESIYIIGGGSVYHEAINHPATRAIFLTKIAGEFDCDTFFPAIPARFSNTEKIGEDEENNLRFEYLRLFS